MSFSFTPLSDAQLEAIQNRELLDKGIYPFTVKAIEEQYSKSGNPMLKIRIGVLASKDDERNLFDYLLATERMIFKLKHFCNAIGLGDQYDAGILKFSDCINRSGQVRIGIQKGNAKEDGQGFYPDRNCVDDYVKLINLNKAIEPDFNDDITF